jgi:hypothetical protein
MSCSSDDRRPAWCLSTGPAIQPIPPRECYGCGVRIPETYFYCDRCADGLGEYYDGQ